MCGEELTDTNRSKEHIVNNGIGGRLKSYNLLCKTCNTKMGDSTDASLAEDLKFFVEMFQIQKERNKELKGIVMKNPDGEDVIVRDAGQKLTLRKPLSRIIDEEGDKQTLEIHARDKKELQKFLESYVKRGQLPQEDADKILASAQVKEDNRKLKINLCLRKESFPSIIKSLANLYVERTNDRSSVAHLKQYLIDKKDCQQIIAVMILPQLRLSPDSESVYHTLFIKGSSGKGLIGIAEYFSTYSYGVILNENYAGPEIEISYCYDVVNLKEIPIHPQLNISIEEFNTIKQQFHSTPQPFWEEMVSRMNAVMQLWETRQRNIKFSEIIQQVLTEEIGEGRLITLQAIDKISKRIFDEYLYPRMNIKE